MIPSQGPRNKAVRRGAWLCYPRGSIAIP